MSALKHGLTGVVLGAFLAVGVPSSAQTPENVRPLHFGITKFTEPNTKDELFKKTFEAIRAAVAPREVYLTIYSTKSFLEDALEKDAVDIVMSGAGVYRRRLDQGLRDIATMVSAQEPNPERAVGSVFIMRSDAPVVQSLSDLRGMTLAARYPLNFQGICIALGEVAAQGFDPDRFFSSVSYRGGGEDNVADAVKSRTASVGVVRTCWLEDMAALGTPVTGVKPVLIKAQDESRCMTSTELYPNWTLSITRNLSPTETWKIVRAVHAMEPTANGMGWTVASDFSRVDALNRTLKIGPYEFLRGWSWQRLWTQYRTVLVVAAAALLLLILHSLRAGYLVRRRTEELNAAYSRERALEESRKAAAEKLNLQMRVNMVHQMSSLAAHELSQPLAAIACYTKSLRRLMNKSAEIRRPVLEEAVESIDRNAQQAAKILQKVRSAAKNKPAELKDDDLNDVVKYAVAHFEQVYGKAKTVQVLTARSEAPLPVSADRDELELALINVMKNAKEAVEGRESPTIWLETGMDAESRQAVVRIWDNGPALSEDALKRMTEPLNTTKEDGLGLGLPIVQSVAERHGGGVVLQQSALGGLEVVMTIPLLKDEQDAE